MNTKTVIMLAELQCHKTLDQNCNCVRIGQFKHQEACGSRDQVCLVGQSAKIIWNISIHAFMHAYLRIMNASYGKTDFFFH